MTEFNTSTNPMSNAINNSSNLNGDDDKNKKKDDGFLRRTINRVLMTFGINFPSDIPKGRNDTVMGLTRFSEKEMKHFPGFNKFDQVRTATIGPELIDRLAKASQDSQAWASEVATYDAMAPEIDTAARIMAASIISPNDMQSDGVSIEVTDTGLGESIEQEASRILTEFYNKQYKLVYKMDRWIQEALYKTGAVPLLVLPDINIQNLTKAVDADAIRQGQDPDDYIKPTISSRRDNNPIGTYSAESLSQEELASLDNDKAEPLLQISEESLGSFSNWEFSDEGYIKTEDVDPYFMQAFDEAMESIYDIKYEKMDDENSIPNADKKQVAGTVREVMKKIGSLLNNSRNYIYISSNPDSIRKGRNHYMEKSDKLRKEVMSQFLFNSIDDPYSVYMMDPSRPDSEKGIATMIELPYQATIPVIVPGDPRRHIGYFIIVDKWGAPIQIPQDVTNLSMTPRKLGESAMQAMFGGPMGTANLALTENERFETTAVIFSAMMKALMEKKLESYGLSGTALERNDAINTCVFRHLLIKKRVGLVFVPASLITYLAYDFHNDGTGKSLTEKVRVILALRSTLKVAGVLAATENSIDHKTIEVALDEKNTNPAQYLTQLNDIYTRKKRIRFTNDPNSIQDDIIQKSVTMVPKGMKGLQDAMSVQVEHRNGSSVEPNRDLDESLTQMIIAALVVPAAAHNKTSEDEFSRGIATSNLFYNNVVRVCQRTTCELLDAMIQRHVRYSPSIYTKLIKLVTATKLTRVEMNKESKKKTPTKGEEELMSSAEILSKFAPLKNAGVPRKDRPNFSDTPDPDEEREKIGKDEPTFDSPDEQPNDIGPDFGNTPNQVGGGDPPNFGDEENEAKNKDKTPENSEGDQPADAPDSVSTSDTPTGDEDAVLQSGDQGNMSDKEADTIGDQDDNAQGYEEHERKRTIPPESKQKIPYHSEKDIAKNLNAILSNIHIVLPPPRVIVDKNHFQEISDYLRTLDEVIQVAYPDDMAGENADWGTSLRIIRANLKQKLASDFIKKIGFGTNYDIPGPEDLDGTELPNFFFMLNNWSVGVKNAAKVIVADQYQPQNNGGMGGGSDMFGGMGGGSDMFGSGMDTGGTAGPDDLGGEPPAGQDAGVGGPPNF